MESTKARIREVYEQTFSRLKEKHIGCFEGMYKPLLLISDTYPGVWLEHVYDSVMMAKLEPDYLPLAVNTISLFIDHQTEEGQLPCYVWNGAKVSCPKKDLVGYAQIQECVSFPRLCVEVCRMADDRALWEKCYAAAKNWDRWLRANRMTTKRGLIEMFVGYDTGHDESGRLAGLRCPGNYVKDGVRQNAAVLPENDPAAPILAVDMNCNFYGTQTALQEMAEELGYSAEAAEWREKAKAVKKALFARCYDENDGFFYDEDKNGEKRRFRSSTIFHLFLERVLDPEEDREKIDVIYKNYITNPKEFGTPYPFPSMSVSDPSWKKHTPKNCWGYFSQGLIAFRCTRWMDAYGWKEDFDRLCEIWVDTWTKYFDTLHMGQELDPITGVPSASSEWYSSTMLFYVYAVRRLGLLND